MSVSLDELPLRLSSIIQDYAEEVNESVSNKLDETANEILDYIKKNCPRSSYGSRHLADSFILTTIGSGASKVIYISSATKGRLVHLIELGFRHRNGKYLAARPFMRPAYDTFTPQMLEAIKAIIKRGGTS